MKFTAYTTICALFATVSVLAQDFSGSGQIYVLNSTSFSTATPDESIGCLDVTGAFSESNCATFTKLNAYPNTLSSSAGNCSFTDSSMPANTDSKYGSKSYAWHCRADYVATVSDSFYTVQGFNYPFLCHGDTNCYYDVKALPTEDVTTPTWEYLWGSQQQTVPAGHTQVLFLWNQTA
ncbi:hypothetical protein F4819DRAFT_460886 [Hypoxylon fuscum]|nr:hypothetical protein F4819DRAFT_460886 [Hypoxylon fuscum]